MKKSPRRGQRLEGRISSISGDKKRHKMLVTQIYSIIERARDSTMMDAEYDARLMEKIFECHPIEITLPKNSHNREGNSQSWERWFAVENYLLATQVVLWAQGLVVKSSDPKERPGILIE